MSIAIVAGAMGSKPMNGGFAWVPLSYARGLRRLGFDVYMLEQIAKATPINRAYFLEVTGAFGFGGHSALLSGDGAVTGLDETEMRRLASEAEVLVNISGHARLDWVVGGPRISAYVDTDPGFTQIWHRGGLLPASVRDHSHHFSVGGNLGTQGCLVPDDGIQWRPLPPPVVLEDWPAAGHPPSEMSFTTVATWRCPSGLVSLDGLAYLPSKLHEFRRMLQLPSLVDGVRFEIALDIQPADAADREALLSCGWNLVDPHVVARDPCSFLGYVAASAAEFSTVQGVYAAANTGWISDRSVRYLASGRPVVVQGTGVSKAIAGDEGMLEFNTLADAERQVRRIATDYATHSTAARRLAEQFFDSDRVLGNMLDQVGARP